MKSRDSYEIIRPEDVGVEEMEMVLTARSGRHAFKNDVSKFIETDMPEEEFEELFAMFLELADKKKEVHTHDLYYLVDKFYAKKGKNQDNDRQRCKLFELISLQVVSNDIFPSANVKVKFGDEIFEESATGDGPIDSLYTALKKVFKLNTRLTEYKISSISKGKEALGKVVLKVEYEGQSYSAKAIDTDIIKASAHAFINAINAIILSKEMADNGQ